MRRLRDGVERGRARWSEVTPAPAWAGSRCGPWCHEVEGGSSRFSGGTARAVLQTVALATWLCRPTYCKRLIVAELAGWASTKPEPLEASLLRLPILGSNPGAASISLCPRARVREFAVETNKSLNRDFGNLLPFLQTEGIPTQGIDVNESCRASGNKALGDSHGDEIDGVPSVEIRSAIREQGPVRHEAVCRNQESARPFTLQHIEKDHLDGASSKDDGPRIADRVERIPTGPVITLQRGTNIRIGDEAEFAELRAGCLRARRLYPLSQIASPTSPSSTDVFSCGRSPLPHSAEVCSTRYRMGPPSGLSLRSMGRGTQTNSVRISSAVSRTFA